jgi:hypothetical protein
MRIEIALHLVWISGAVRFTVNGFTSRVTVLSHARKMNSNQWDTPTKRLLVVSTQLDKGSRNTEK